MKYPELEMYMFRNGLSLRKFSGRCNIPSSTMCRILNGETEPLKSTIDKILKATDMPYEVCFREENRCE